MMFLCLQSKNTEYSKITILSVKIIKYFTVFFCSSTVFFTLENNVNYVFAAIRSFISQKHDKDIVVQTQQFAFSHSSFPIKIQTVIICDNYCLSLQVCLVKRTQ